MGLLNIVYGIYVVQPTDEKYTRASTVLGRGERLTRRKAGLLVFVYSTLDAEVAIECDAVIVEEGPQIVRRASPSVPTDYK